MPLSERRASSYNRALFPLRRISQSPCTGAPHYRTNVSFSRMITPPSLVIPLLIFPVGACRRNQSSPARQGSADRRGRVGGSFLPSRRLLRSRRESPERLP